MKKNATPIPVRSVVCLPRWLMVGSVGTCGLLMAACFGGVVYGIGWVEGPGRWGWIGGCLGGAGGCAGGLYGTLCDWRRRLPAPALLAHLQHDEPSQFYRRVFWPALAAAALGLALLLGDAPRWAWQGLLHPGGMLALMSGGMECIRRHTTTRARALFALYADGALDAADMAAIDGARQQDAKFDAEVRAWQQVGARVQELLTPP